MNRKIVWVCKRCARIVIGNEGEPIHTLRVSYQCLYKGGVFDLHEFHPVAVIEENPSKRSKE